MIYFQRIKLKERENETMEDEPGKDNLDQMMEDGHRDGMWMLHDPCYDFTSACSLKTSNSLHIHTYTHTPPTTVEILKNKERLSCCYRSVCVALH